jgi:hypothetical protein
MHPPDQLRIWAADIRAYAASCSNADDMKECLLLAGRYDDLARATEQVMRALTATGDQALWRVRS